MKVLLLGLGRANLGVARYLLARGEELFLYEEHPSRLSIEANEMIASGKVKNFKEDKYDLVISSPGFSENKDIINHLKAMGMAIVDEVEFTYQHLKTPKIIAITGTNGKSTTASLISNVLTSAKIKNFLGGNISPGRPFSQALFEEEFEYYVLEISSFQLTRIKTFQPHIAVLTNIAIDHLDWHGDFNEYIAAKMRIFSNQNKDDFAILNFEDETIKKLAVNLCAKIIYFGRPAKDGAWLDGNFHYQKEKIFSTRNLALIGEHNLMNILAAIAVAKILKIANKEIEQGVKKSKPLPHRLEDLGVVDGVRYINNSMCTNESAAIASFKTIKGNKIVIVGGRAKGGRSEQYLDLLIKEAKACVILGDNASDIAQYFKDRGFTRHSIARDMAEAIRESRGFASAGDTIILNPGFASFGLFRDFVQRGEAFKNGIDKD